MASKPPRVFISYSHDNDRHDADVLRLSTRLRRKGIDTSLDQYDEAAPPLSWPNWMRQRIDEAKYVLVVCTEVYKRRALDEEEPEEGRGVRWEGCIITSSLYNRSPGADVKFIPVYLRKSDRTHIPYFLAETSAYLVDESAESQFDALLRHLHNAPRVTREPLGPNPFGPVAAEASALDVGENHGPEQGIPLDEPAVPQVEHATAFDAVSFSLPFSLFKLDSEDGWSGLSWAAGDDGDPAFTAALDVARDNGALTAVVEAGVVDRDFESEHREYLSRLHTSPRRSALRLHFFAAAIDLHQLWQLPLDASYLGYVTLRWRGPFSVGASMLRPPPRMGSFPTAHHENVFIFGQWLSVRAVPFMQYPGFGRGSAAIALWECHRAAALERKSESPDIAAFALAAQPAAGLLRVSGEDVRGLELQQLRSLSATLGRPVSVRYVEALPELDTLSAIQAQSVDPADAKLRRFVRTCGYYLRSGVPLIGLTIESEAELICGLTEADQKVTAWVHNSHQGPYRAIEVTAIPWDVLLIPMPEDVFLAPEAAEMYAAVSLQSAEYSSESMLTHAEPSSLEYQTGLVDTRKYLVGLADRGFPQGVVTHWRLARLPASLWVTQVVDRRQEPRFSVIAEVAVDPTSTRRSPNVLLMFRPGGTAHMSYAEQSYVLDVRDARPVASVFEGS